MRHLPDEPGFVASELSTIIIPQATARALHCEEDERRRAAQEIAAGVMAEMEDPETTFKRIQSQGRPIRSPQHRHQFTGCVVTRPRQPGEVRVFDEEELRRRIDLHNRGQSTDEELLVRDFGLLERLAERTQWRALAQPKTDGFARLRAQCPHLADVVDLIEGQYEVSRMTGAPTRLAPLLLVGGPGVGKSYFAAALASTLSTASRLIDMSSAQTNAGLHGTDRHWSTTTPGSLFELVLMGEHANPVLILDEIDKATAINDRYSPLGPLHSALEPVTAARSRDLSVAFEFDASWVSYVATANSLKGLPDSLLSRFHVVHARAPSTRQAVEMARVMVMSAAKESGFESVEPGVVRLLAQRPPRALLMMLKAGMGRAAARGRRTLTLDDFEQCPMTKVTH